MATTTTATPTGEVVLIPLGQIQPSSTNPRRAFDDAALRELAASIAAVGVQQPIILRRTPTLRPPGSPHSQNTPYEIVAGERRWRASKLAKKQEVPAIVRVLGDEEARSIQIVENLQRADLHPMEEAEAYRELAAGFRFPEGIAPNDDAPWSPKNAPRIAAAVGKSVDYVTKRCRLLTLIKEAQDAFRDRDISLDHALLLAALEPADQDRALRFVFNPRGYLKEKTIAALRGKLRDPGKHENYVGPEISTVRELRHWIEESVALELSKAEWDLEDRHLVPEAGACTTCPKRTGSNEALFGGLIDVKDETCMDAACFKAKRAAFVQVTAAAVVDAGKQVVRISHKETSAKPATDKRKNDTDPDLRVFKVGQFVEAKKGECENVVTGVFVDAPENTWGTFAKVPAGAKRSVCIADDCKKHRKAYQRSKSTARGASAPRVDPEVARKQREAAEADERGLRVEIVKRIVASFQSWPPAFHRLLLELAIEGRGHREEEAFSLCFDPKLKSEAKAREYFFSLKPESKQLAQALAALVLSNDLHVYMYDAQALARGRRELVQNAERLDRGDVVKKLIKEHDAAKAKAAAVVKQAAKKKSAAA